MAIVAKSVIEARRAASAVAVVEAAAAAAASLTTAELTPAPPNPSRPAHGMPPDAVAPPRRRGHAVRDENGKFQPTGDYGNGFARPPVETRFKPGGRGGPGRPKGSLSHDALMEKHLKQKREVSVGGRRQKLSTHELLVMSTVKAALEGKDKRARDYALATSQRLYPSRDSNPSDADAPMLSASDALSLVEYEQELREQIRSQVIEELRLERAAVTGGIRDD